MSTISPLLLPAAKKLYDSVQPWDGMSLEQMRATDPGYGSLPDLSAMKVEEIRVPGDSEAVRLTVYKPEHADGTVALYIHGGGWIVGNNDTHAAGAANLAFYSKMTVVAVDYALAPEAPFPAAVRDCWTAVEWLAANAGKLGSGSNNFAVVGDSAGGNLTAVMTLMAKQKNLAGITAQVPISMVADLSSFETASYKEFWDDKLVPHKDMEMLQRKYLQGANPRQWEASPLLADDFSGLPPAYVVTAEVDVLRDEAEAYAEKLKAAGVAVTVQRFKGFYHTGMMDNTVFPQEAEQFYRGVGDFIRSCC